MPNGRTLPPFLLEFEPLWVEPGASEAFEAALTRRAWLQEHGSDSPLHHDSLEWLGDRMLESVVAKELWRRFPYEDPKRLDAARQDLCSAPLLTAIGKHIGINEHVRKGRGEIQQKQVRSGKGISDHVEAVLGAAFLAGGDPGVEALVRSWWAAHWPEQLSAVSAEHPSGELNRWVTQIWMVSLSKDRWMVLGNGPFQATVTLPDCASFTGEERPNKQDAKASAAERALPHLRALGNDGSRADA